MTRIAALVIALCLIPSASRAQEGTYRVSPYLLVGGGGDLKVNASNSSEGATLDTNASVGFGGRFEAAIHEYISIGGLFEYAALQREGISFFGVTTVPDKDKLLNFDVWVKGGTRFDLGPGKLEVYGGIPFGLTLGVTSITGDERETYPGYNLGLLGGVQYWIGRFGVFTELGYRFHKVIDREFQDSNVRVSYRISQLIWHLGGSVSF